LNSIMNFRTYAFASLLNLRNYKSVIFIHNISFLINLLIFGQDALRKINASYIISDGTLLNYEQDSVIYSNAVLEHFYPSLIPEFLKLVSESKPRLFMGIIDTNDHSARFLNDDSQFINYSGTNFEIQTRGNNISKGEWESYLCQNFLFNHLETLVVRKKIIHRVVYFISHSGSNFHE
jgi:hypothetical protein